MKKTSNGYLIAENHIKHQIWFIQPYLLYCTPVFKIKPYCLMLILKRDIISFFLSYDQTMMEQCGLKCNIIYVMHYY